MALRAAAALFVAWSGLVPAQEPPKPAPEQKPPAESILSIEKSTKPPPCIIKPVMTDDELRACGARVPR